MCRKTGAIKKSKVETVCLESLWKGKLRQKGWDDMTIACSLLHWSPNTLHTYDTQLNKYIGFMKRAGVDPQSPSEVLIAQYFM